MKESTFALSRQIIRGEDAETPLKAGLVGGGSAGLNLLRLFDEDRLSRLNMEFLGLCDKNPEAPGMGYARRHNLFTTTNLDELFALKDLNLIIELTGSKKTIDEIIQKIPSGVSLIDHTAARLLWDLVQIEVEKTELERERQRYEEKRKKSTQVILNSLPYRIMVVNLDMTVDTVNETFLKEFGITRSQVLGKRCYEIRYNLHQACGQEDRDCFLMNRLEELKEKGLITNYQEHVDAKGETRFDVITVAPIFDEQGELIQILEASRDVTDRIKLEREVQKSNTFFENVIKSTVDGIVVVDTKGNVIIFNEGMEKLTGYSAKEVKHLTSFYNIDVAKESMRMMRSDQHGPYGKLNPTSINITTKDGEEIPVTLSASIIFIKGEPVGSVGVFTDMREILEMRKQVEEAHLQLIQSEKIASVGRMAAGVAHEINNPLSGILLYAELLKENLMEDPQNTADAQEIIDQTIRCKKIVAELLEFSRQTVGKVTSFQVSELIDKSLNLLINQASFQNIEVQKEIDPRLPSMIGDFGQLQQVLINLFTNAADAMEGRGVIKVDTKFFPESNQFTISIADTGPGIPESLRGKIFDIFFTTKPAGKGTGLGLSISQNIIKLHGGSIKIHCPPQGGTEFTVQLPLGFIEQPVSPEEPLFQGLDEQ